MKLDQNHLHLSCSTIFLPGEFSGQQAAQLKSQISGPYREGSEVAMLHEARSQLGASATRERIDGLLRLTEQIEQGSDPLALDKLACLADVGWLYDEGWRALPLEDLDDEGYPLPGRLNALHAQLEEHAQAILRAERAEDLSEFPRFPS